MNYHELSIIERRKIRFPSFIFLSVQGLEYANRTQKGGYLCVAKIQELEIPLNILGNTLQLHQAGLNYRRILDLFEKTDSKIKEWYAFLNDAAGLLGFSLFISAITSSAPESVASISITFLSVWLMLKARGVHKHLRREERLKGFFASNLGAIGGSIIFLASFTLLFLTATGYFTIEKLKLFTFSSVIYLG
ncbi:hypothetical protein [Aeromonas veronii]|uniref:hypothetical protein n=1 Tax=Aeromonas veronii TaxID=654 RepID=UPI000956423A|nr:hypothetical protein [Aeromonas veronii]SIR04615.1 hypothetical protein SAMN05892873_1253 [Aeromonas veronii]